jgi:AraC-like DNA-binding protein
MSAHVKIDDSTFAPIDSLLATGTAVRFKYAEVLARQSAQFDSIYAELCFFRSVQLNELEICPGSHIILMRCEGIASRCEIDWIEDGHRQTLSELKPGSIIFCPAGGRVRISKKDQGCFTDISLAIPPSALEVLNDMHLDSGRVRLTSQADCGRAELCQILFAMRDEISLPGPAGRIYKEALALQLIVQLLRYPTQLAIAPAVAKGGLSAHKLRRAIELIEADLTKTPSLSELAEHVGLSVTHFCTAFKQSTGHPPHRYLLGRRVAHAKSLIGQSSLTLTEVALACGFASSSQFATAFHRISGTTPSGYRRSL